MAIDTNSDPGGGERASGAADAPPAWQPSAGEASEAADHLSEPPPEGKVAHGDRWPPPWLQATAILAVVAISCFLMLTVFRFFENVAELVSQLGSTRALRSFVTPVRAYVATHSEGFSFDRRELFGIWSTSGLVLFLFSSFGSRGARAGWFIFGALTAVMVKEGAEPKNAGPAIGIWALWWSILSIWAFRRTSDYQDDAPRFNRRGSELASIWANGLSVLLLGSRYSGLARSSDSYAPAYGGAASDRAAELRGAQLQQRVMDNVARRGFPDAASYLKANWGRSRQVLSEELGAPEWFLKELIKVSFPPRPGEAIGRVPWQIKQEAADRFKEGETFAAIGRRYCLTGPTISRWIKEMGVERSTSLSPSLRAGPYSGS